MIKKTIFCGFALLASACGPLWADGLAKCSQRVGSVRVTSAAGVARDSKSVQEGDRLTLGPGASLTLVFLGDSHRELLTGPCVVTIKGGHAMLMSGSGSVTRRDTHGKVVAMATTGNTEAQGGHQASHGSLMAAPGAPASSSSSAPRSQGSSGAVAPASLLPPPTTDTRGRGAGEVVERMQLLVESGKGAQAAALGTKSLVQYPGDEELCRELYRIYLKVLPNKARALDMRVRAMAAGIDVSKWPNTEEEQWNTK